MDDHQAHREWHEVQRRDAEESRAATEAQRLERMRQVGDQNPLIKRARDARLEHVRTHHPGRNTPRHEEIIAAALEILDESGLSALSLREIAKRLNIRAPALYWYFKSKDELVDYMAQAILMKEFADLKPRDDAEPWQDWLRSQMVRLRRAMLAYTDGGRVVAGAAIYPATALSDLFETTLTSLTSAGIDLQVAYHIAVATTRYTFGYVIEEQASPSFEELEDADVRQHLAPYALVSQVISELEAAGVDEDQDFAIGLEYIIAGGTAATS